MELIWVALGIVLGYLLIGAISSIIVLHQENVIRRLKKKLGRPTTAAFLSKRQEHAVDALAFVIGVVFAPFSVYTVLENFVNLRSLRREVKARYPQSYESLD